MPARTLKKILLVDDEQSILLSLSYLLRTEGVEVTCCSEIEQAKEVLKTDHFDLVLTDVKMSGVHGVEGLELLRYIHEHYDTDVMIMTGFGTQKIREEALRCGACYFFEKPLDIPLLLRQVALRGIPVKQQRP